MTEHTYYYAIMPYLKTTHPIVIRGIPFWPSHDLEKNDRISEDCKAHLKTLFSLFYLMNDTGIENMIYTCFRFTSDRQNASEQLSRLREARSLIGFLYSSPHFPGGDPFLTYEHFDLHLFSSARVSKFLLGVEDEDTTSSTPESLAASFVDGYEGILNWHTHFSVAAGSKIYPSLPGFWLNISQDLSHDLSQFESQSPLWPIVHFIQERRSSNEKTRHRIFTAIDWYNRSCSRNVGEEVSLVHLATAFESLFNLPNDTDLTKRFKESVILLLGDVPRLGSWIEQFYKARSKILHEGSWPHMGFYAADSNVYKSILDRKRDGIVYRRLTAYGLRIFRLCFQTILAGTLATEKSGLASMFFHNQERLTMICKELNRGDVEPSKKFKSISQHVFELHEYWLESEELTDIETVIGAGVLMIETYLATHPSLPVEVNHGLLSIKDKESDLTPHDQLKLFSTLSKLLSQWSQADITIGNAPPESPISVLHEFVKYAAKPGFLVRTWPKTAS